MTDTESNNSSNVPLAEIFDQYSTYNRDGTRSMALKEIKIEHLKEIFSGLTGKDVVITEEDTGGQRRLIPTKILAVEQVGEKIIEISHVGSDGQEWVIPLHAQEKGLTIRKDSKTKQLLEIGVVYNLEEKTPVVGSDIKYVTYTVIRDQPSTTGK